MKTGAAVRCVIMCKQLNQFTHLCLLVLSSKNIHQNIPEIIPDFRSNQTTVTGHNTHKCGATLFLGHFTQNKVFIPFSLFTEPCFWKLMVFNFCLPCNIQVSLSLSSNTPHDLPPSAPEITTKIPEMLWRSDWRWGKDLCKYQEFDLFCYQGQMHAKKLVNEAHVLRCMYPKIVWLERTFFDLKACFLLCTEIQAFGSPLLAFPSGGQGSKRQLSLQDQTCGVRIKMLREDHDGFLKMFIHEWSTLVLCENRSRDPRQKAQLVLRSTKKLKAMQTWESLQAKECLKSIPLLPWANGPLFSFEGFFYLRQKSPWW